MHFQIQSNYQRSVKHHSKPSEHKLQEISWEPAAHMPEELIKEFWASHPEISKDEIYATPDFYTSDTTEPESERIPLARRCEHCNNKESVKVNKDSELSKNIVLEDT